MSTQRALLVILISTLALLLLPSIALPTHAGSGVLYVSLSDPTCGGQAPCYTTIQAAIDAAAAGDEIRVAADAYTGTQLRTYSGNTYKQVAIITKTLTLRGGYTTANWTTSKPSANPTVINAGGTAGIGRGITILGTGSETVTVDGFTITGGDYTGLGNPDGVAHQVCARTGGDCGGGLFAQNVTLILRNSSLSNNTASQTRLYSDGGGAYLWSLRSGSQIENTTFISNNAPTSGGEGGGVAIDFGQGITITRSLFQNNQASGSGGGLFIFQPGGAVVIDTTTFLQNRSLDDLGGALEGRLTFSGAALRLNRVLLWENRAHDQAAAISLIKQGSGATQVEMTNVLLADNTFDAATSNQAVVNASGGSGGSLDLSLKHLTWAAHSGVGALRLEASLGQAITATLSNVLIDTASSAFIGNQVSGSVTINHTNSLPFNVTTLHQTEAGSPAFVATNTLSGNPLLDSTYHLQSGSAAIDAGINAGVTDDIDGDLRDNQPDVGADEYRLHIYLPLILKQP